MYPIMRFLGGKPKAFTLSYDDRLESDFRLAELMRRYSIKGTFNINTGSYPAEDKEGYCNLAPHTRMKLSRLQEFYRLYADIAELAIHTANHPFLTRLSPEAITWQVISDRRAIEELTGKPCRGMAYPQGPYNQTVLSCLPACGVAYARTTKTTKEFTLPQNWLEFHTTCHHKNEALFELADTFLTTTSYLKMPLLFSVWGHTYELDDMDQWGRMEELFALLSGKNEVWFATNIEICDYVKAYEALQFSCDLTSVYNPTATPVSFALFSRKELMPEVTVQPGELCDLKKIIAEAKAR